MKIKINLHCYLLMWLFAVTTSFAGVESDFDLFCRIEPQNMQVREEARARIVADPKGSVVYLRKVILSGTSIQKQCAAQLLGLVGSVQDEQLLFGVLDGDDPFAAKNAQSALVELYGRLGRAELVSRINLHNKRKDSLMAALYAGYLLGKGVGKVPVAVETAAGKVLLGARDIEVQLGAALLLGYSGTSSGIKALLKCAATETTPVAVLCEVCASLEGIVPAGTSKTIEKLSVRPEPQLQLAALGVLGKLNYAGVCDALRLLTANPSPEIRATALQKLSKYGNLQNMGDFVRALSDKSPQVRLEAVLALGKLANPAAAGSLRELMGKTGDRNPVVRAQAALAFSRCGSMGGLSPLLEDVRDLSMDNREFRLEAIRVLGDLGDEGAVRALAECLDDADTPIALAALYSLYKLDSQNARQLINRAKTHKSAAVRTAALSLKAKAK